MKGWENIELARQNPRVAAALGEKPQRRSRGGLPATTVPDCEGLARLRALMEHAGFDMRGWRYELQFHPEREWRFDLAHPRLKVAIEYDGMRGVGGHEGWHRSWRGYQVDREKDAEAQLLGWLVLRIVHPMLVRRQWRAGIFPLLTRARR